jgi:hypothetical protein
MGTRLNLRNVGKQPIEADQWRVPLSVECAEGITEVQAVGVSYPDIKVSVQSTPSEPNRAILQVSRLDPGDEVAFEIRHGKTRKAPQVKGEIRGAPESFVQGLTIAQRLGIMFPVLFLLSLEYVALCIIVWLAQVRLDVSGILQGILFLFASPLLQIPIGAWIYRGATREQPNLSLGLAVLAILVNLVLQPVALVVALLVGYQLWYPQFAVYVAVLWLMVRIITRQPFSANNGLSGPREIRGGGPAVPPSSGITTFIDGVSLAVFAGFVVAGAGTSTLIFVGLIAALANAISRMDRQWLGSRVPLALGNPRSQLLGPPRADPRTRPRRPRHPVHSARAANRLALGSGGRRARRNNLAAPATTTPRARPRK